MNPPKCKIDALLESEGAIQHSQWQKLKESGEIPQKSTLSEYWASFDALAQLSAQLPPLLHVTAERKQQMVSEALSLHSREMRRLSSAKRYALAVALIEYRWAQSLDQLVTLLIKILREIESTAIRLYAEKIMQQGDKTSFLVSTLKDILYHWGATDSTDERQNYLDTLYNTRGETLIDACHQHLAHQSEGHRPAMVKLFVKKRTILIEIIKRLPIAADANCRSLVNFKSKILSHSKKHRVITIDKDQYDLSWLSKAWQELAITHDPNTSVQHVHLHTLEIAWFTAIKNNFKSYHCFVEGAHAYGNPENYMVTWQKFDELLPHITSTTDLPPDGKTFVKTLKAKLKQEAKEIDNQFEAIKGAYFNGDELVLQKAHTKYSSPTLLSLKTGIAKKMPKTTIIDVLSDTVRWLDLEKLFKPLSGNETKIQDAKLRIVLSLFCFGCNVGARQTANSVRNISEKQVSWLNARHIDSGALKKAIKKVVNQFNTMSLPKKWGTGKRASADGTLRQTFDANLLSEFHARYQKRGAIGYYMVSDQYIALFSHFIACGAHESWYILDGISKNEMDIQPNILHGDTHAQNYAVFGLAHLLGIELMPRIRGIKKLTFFKPTPQATYKNIRPLFKDFIRWDLIAKAYPDMLRLVMSIQQGLLVPSVILRRLSTSHDPLARGLIELGKVVRTRFLLLMISDVNLRKIQSRETNKVEQYHEFLQWITFGNGGIIRSNDPIEQEKMIQYQHLVSDLVVLYNTHHMTKAINALRQEQYQIVEEDLAHISPYNRYGLRLIGDYRVDIERKLEPLEKMLLS